MPNGNAPFARPPPFTHEGRPASHTTRQIELSILFAKWIKERVPAGNEFDEFNVARALAQLLNAAWNEKYRSQFEPLPICPTPHPKVPKTTALEEK